MVKFANTDALASAKGRVPPSQGNEHPLPRARNSALLHAEMPDKLAGFMTQDVRGPAVWLYGGMLTCPRVQAGVWEAGHRYQLAHQVSEGGYLRS